MTAVNFGESRPRFKGVFSRERNCFHQSESRDKLRKNWQACSMGTRSASGKSVSLAHLWPGSPISHLYPWMTTEFAVRHPRLMDPRPFLESKERSGKHSTGGNRRRERSLPPNLALSINLTSSSRRKEGLCVFGHDARGSWRVHTAATPLPCPKVDPGVSWGTLETRQIVDDVHLDNTVPFPSVF
ncbi:hypothetical protein ALC62_08027 [Cyphomyrmex costatus]|uniref:Uncharacterized protein n=1 Tax=Cyphomyrmex costatus TaxID=456900 RepID=A0A195CKC9_9HYME|nr:hypothetical protein ALC62_08027 [Cyphomyrmex costatus]